MEASASSTALGKPDCHSRDGCAGGKESLCLRESDARFVRYRPCALLLRCTAVTMLHGPGVGRIGPFMARQRARYHPNEVGYDVCPAPD